MRFLSLLLLLVLTACQVTVPAQPTPVPQWSAQSASSMSSAAPLAYSVVMTQTWTPQPTLTPTPGPTATLTPSPTLTPRPTTTPTSRPSAAPVLLIERPLPDEFVSTTIMVAGNVANVADGIVMLELR